MVAFMSFAVSRGFGAQHPLVALADRLHDVFGVRLGPLTTFYDTDTEDAEDVEKLERAWQEPGPLRESLAAITDVLATDGQSQTLALMGGAVGLLEEIGVAVSCLERAESAGRRVRLSYAL
jgi:hypothetical protein